MFYQGAAGGSAEVNNRKPGAAARRCLVTQATVSAVPKRSREHLAGALSPGEPPQRLKPGEQPVPPACRSHPSALALLPLELRGCLENGRMFPRALRWVSAENRV